MTTLDFLNILLCAMYVVALIVCGNVVKTWSDLNTAFKSQLKNLNELTAQGIQLKNEYVQAIAKLDDDRAALAAKRKHWDSIFAGAPGTGAAGLSSN